MVILRKGAQEHRGLRHQDTMYSGLSYLRRNGHYNIELKAEFCYTDPSRSMRPKWWQGGEPLWVTAEKQNVKTAIHMWPESEHRAQFPRCIQRGWTAIREGWLHSRTSRYAEFGGKFGDDSAITIHSCICAVVDSDEPNSTEIQKTRVGVDTLLQDIFSDLDRSNLTKIWSILWSSAITGWPALRLIDRYSWMVWPTLGWWNTWTAGPCTGYGRRTQATCRAYTTPCWPSPLKIPTSTSTYGTRTCQTETTFPRASASHRSGSSRRQVGPFSTRRISTSSRQKRRIKHTIPKACTGMTPTIRSCVPFSSLEAPSSRTRQNSKLDVFQNTDVYNIVCDSLDIAPIANNRNLRLPPIPIGLHSDHPDTDESELQALDAHLELSNAPAASPPTNTSTVTNATTMGQEDGSDEKSLWD